ncbi:TetR/AcrR family transcriptional regulator [Nocardia asteroides]|uniref:TetR/AcrR family transcriptional regulator n=1 Tax=Nocardia asteroides TaxID=1824 RepID=UPI0037C9F8CE
MTPATTSYAKLLDPAVEDPTDARILDAALELFAELGISRVGIDDIARHAKINRATVYRRIGAKDEIVRAAVLREISRFLDRMAARLRAVDDPHQRIIDGFALTLTELREHPILRKTLAVDREHTLATITVDAAASLTLATEFVAHEILAVRPGQRRDDTVDVTAAMIVRLIHSLVLIPDAPPQLRTRADMRDFADRHLVPLIGPATP